MKFILADGTFAHLNAIVQTQNYRRAYVGKGSDALAQIMQWAKQQMPPWPTTPMIVIGRDPGKLLDGRELPPVMCIGEFVSYRERADGSRKALFRHVVWLQDDVVPHMSDENQLAFSNIRWEDDLAGQSAIGEKGNDTGT